MSIGNLVVTARNRLKPPEEALSTFSDYVSDESFLPDLAQGIDIGTQIEETTRYNACVKAFDRHRLTEEPYEVEVLVYDFGKLPSVDVSETDTIIDSDHIRQRAIHDRLSITESAEGFLSPLEQAVHTASKYVRGPTIHKGRVDRDLVRGDKETTILLIQQPYFKAARSSLKESKSYSSSARTS